MKKKLVSMLLALTVICAMAAPAYAASASMSNFIAGDKYTSATFGDVSPEAWYGEPVRLCYEYGLMGGKGAGRFDPSGAMTLAEAVAMADRVHQIYASGSSTLKNGTPWYKPYVEYAVANGIVAAADFKDYSAKATRGQMAYIFANALPQEELAIINDILSIPDVTEKTEYGAEIYLLYCAGVLTGNDRYGTFAPDSTISRCEAAAIISRMAIPQQRKAVTLYEDFTESVAKFSMPVGTQKESDEFGISYKYLVGGKMSMSAVISAVDPTVNGGGIKSNLTMAECQTLLEDNLKQSGVDASVTDSKTVKFRSTDAYRYAAAIKQDGDMQLNAYIYVLIIGQTAYDIELISQDAQILKTMDASLTVNGAAAK